MRFQLSEELLTVIDEKLNEIPQMTLKDVFRHWMEIF
jgi:hypothetical protein